MRISADWRGRRKWLALALFGALLLGAGAWRCFGQPPEMREHKVTKIDQRMKISAATRIEQTVFYEKCREEEKRALNVKAEEVGLGYAEFQAMYPGWNIELFNAERITMSFLDRGCCSEHRKHKFVGVQGDYVAVFYGKPADKPVLKELTRIKAASLQPQALEEARRGIVFESGEEMLRILEGLHAS